MCYELGMNKRKNWSQRGYKTFSGKGNTVLLGVEGEIFFFEVKKDSRLKKMEMLREESP